MTISPTTGAVIAGLNLGHNNPWTAGASFNLNATALPTPLAGTILALANVDATSTRIELDAYGSNSFFSGRRANGTAASPTTLVANDLITNINGLGYDGSAYTTVSSGSFRIYSAGTWSGSSTPTYLDFYTTPTGSTTSASRMRVENDGGITIPSTVTGGDQGAGTVNATNYYAAGVLVDTISASNTLTNKTLTSPIVGGTLTLPDATTWTSSGLSALTVTALAGAGTQCVQVSNAGLLSGTGGACGSGSGAVNSVTNSDGTLTISPTTGSVVASLALNHANTWTAVQTITNSDLRLLGSSTGYTTFTSANAGASNFTLTIPAATDTLALLGAANAFTGNETHSGSEVFTGTTLAAQASGQVQIGGIAAAPTLTTTAQGVITVSATNGLILQGDGSTNDVQINNRSGTAVIQVVSGTTGVTFPGNIQAARLSVAGNGFITAPASGALQFSIADNAAPAGVTLRLNSSVVAGTSNTAGATSTLVGSRATGSGVGGDVVLQTTGTGAAATTVNSVATALTLKGGTQLVVFNASYTVAGLPTGVTGARTFVTDQLTTCAGVGVAPTGGGAVFCPVFYNGSAWVGG